MNTRKDIIGNTPTLGGFVAYNPPRYKGLIIAYITGFSKIGLPQCEDIEYLKKYEGNTWEERYINMKKDYDEKYYKSYTPKTGFVVINYKG